MIDQFFQQELSNLRDLGAEFSRKHPALAPMLSGGATDPDVERLMEGSAFLTALLRQKLDDEFPEFINQMIQYIWPHYLRPLPSATIVAFTPKASVKQPVTIPAGARIASVPVEGTSCIFRTSRPVELNPLDILEASFMEAAGRPPAIRLLLSLRGLKLSDWNPRKLRFFLGGDYTVSADIYYLLRTRLRNIVITPEDGGSPLVLSPDCLKPVGFTSDEGLLLYPSQSFPGYRLLQEFFMLPENFLFLDLTQLDRWKEKGNAARFEIRFELNKIPIAPPRIKTGNFVLSAAPAVNVFPYDADPIRLDHRKTEYIVRPAGAKADHYQVYAVEKVTGILHGSAKQREYAPFDVYSPSGQATPVYHTAVRESPLSSEQDVFLSVAYPPEMGAPVSETLSMALLCTNGSLPENLQKGDICLPTTGSPEFAEFTNIRRPTATVLPPVGSGKNLLWRLLSHLSLNYVSLATPKNLRAVLDLFIFQETRDRTAVIANKRRITGIEDVRLSPSNRIVGGIMMRGQQVRLKLRQDHYAGPGDLYLFGSVLDYFLGVYASINTYTQLFVDESLKGDTYQWPVRIGDRHLI